MVESHAAGAGDGGAGRATGRARRRRVRAAEALVGLGALLTGLTACTPSAPGGAPATPAFSPGTAVPDTSVSPSPSAPLDGDTGPARGFPPGPAEGFPAGPLLPDATAEPQDVLTGLDTPWGLALLPGGAALVTSRDAAQVLLVSSAGAAPLAGPGAEELTRSTTANGEGGLLGVAVPLDVADHGLVYLYRTAAEGNEVVRAVLDPLAGTLGPLERVLGPIPAAGNHNGGRIHFGPDGNLYVATGDAGAPGVSQDPGSLAGKILRVTPDGRPAPGNPDPGTPVWSLGHRNVQGFGWDAAGHMFASEFGQSTVDELNLIEPGGNYGWPEVEGTAGAPGLTDPLVTWSTAEASPSGLAVTQDAVYLAALRGERLWKVPLEGGGVGTPVVALDGLGRMRDVVLGPDGALWILTQNTDGRGSPRQGDDRLVRILPP